MAITNQKLEWIITQHGKDRITELLNNPEKRIRITRMGIGSDGTETPHQRELNGGLRAPITDATGKVIIIPISDKGLSEDRENTVYFKAFIDEDLSGFEIAELALYEEIDGVEYMFAIGVGQPIAKPRLEDNYLYSIEYTLFIESTNLLDIYDRIELDPANEFLKEADIDTLYRTVLFIEGNLIEQIGANTNILGLDRAQQLDELISDTQIHYNSAAISSYYTSLATSVEDLANIIGFWSFHYVSNFGTKRTIKDFSTYLNFFNTNNIISTYTQGYEHLMATLNFEDGDYFYLNPIQSAISMSIDLELGELIDHTLVDDITYSTTKHGWLTKQGTLTEAEVKENIIMYYLKADEAELLPLIIDHQVVPNTIKLKYREPVEGGEPVPAFGKYAFGPHIWEFDAANQVWICDDLGIQYDEGTFKNKIIDYENVEGHEEELPMNGSRISLWCLLGKTPEDGMTISLTGSRFDLLDYSNGNVKLDSPFTFIASLKHNHLGNRNTLLAQSDYFQNIHNFEIVKNEDNAIEVTLFSTSADKYIKFTTAPNAVGDKVYNLVVTYDPNYNAYFDSTPIVKIYINNIYYEVTKEESFRVLNDNTKRYIGMDNNLLESGCFVREESTNNRINTIDAKVCMMGIIKENLDNNLIRCNSLMLNSLTGKTAYYRV